MRIMDEDMRQRRLFICKYCDRRFTSSHAFCGHQNRHRNERAAPMKEVSSHKDTPPRPTVPAYNSPIMTAYMQSSFPLRNRRFQPYHHPFQILTHPRIIPPAPGHPVLVSGPFGGYGPLLRNAAAAADSMGPKLAGGPVMRQTLYDLRFDELVKAHEAAEAEKKEKDQEEKEEELDLTLHL